MSNAPLVLYGALRSGTTLLRLILNAHPAIGCAGERDFMLDALRSGKEGPELDPEVLRESRIFLSSGLTLPATPNGMAAFDGMHAEDRARTGKPHHVLVMHRRLGTLLDLYPDSRIIHLVRDPRDVAHSSVGMGWAGNTWFGIDHWIRTETDWDRQAGRLSGSQVFLLRYEEMLEAPEEILTRLCAFIGVAYDYAMLSFPETSTYAPLDPKLAYQWRRKQSQDEIADVEHKIGTLLSARGYSPSGVLPRSPGVMRRAALTVQDKVFVWRKRLKRFGPVDPLLEMAARRTGIKGLGAGARARMREKEKQYLK